MESHDTGTTHFINLYGKVVALWLSVQDIAAEVESKFSMANQLCGVNEVYVLSIFQV